MKTFGALILSGGVIFLFIALNMSTSVSTGFGQVNNIGLMNDRQNYIMVAGLAIVVGLIMLLAAGKSDQHLTSQVVDPFDEHANKTASDRAARIEARKRYAVSLGITREGGRYSWGEHQFNRYEDAIAYVEANTES